MYLDSATTLQVQPELDLRFESMAKSYLNHDNVVTEVCLHKSRQYWFVDSRWFERERCVLERALRLTGGKIRSLPR